jgi:hypothetical protein
MVMILLVIISVLRVRRWPRVSPAAVKRIETTAMRMPLRNRRIEEEVDPAPEPELMNEPSRQNAEWTHRSCYGTTKMKKRSYKPIKVNPSQKYVTWISTMWMSAYG